MAAVNGCSPFQMLDRSLPHHSLLERIISIHFIFGDFLNFGKKSSYIQAGDEAEVRC